MTRSSGCEKHEKLECHALLLQVRGEGALHKGLFGFKGWASKDICWMRKAHCNAAWKRSLHQFFGGAHLHRCAAREPGHDTERDWQVVSRSGWVASNVSDVGCVRVCVCELTRLRLTVRHVHMQLCLVSCTSPRLFHARSRTFDNFPHWKLAMVRHMPPVTPTNQSSLDTRLANVAAKVWVSWRSKRASTRPQTHASAPHRQN